MQVFKSDISPWGVSGSSGPRPWRSVSWRAAAPPLGSRREHWRAPPESQYAVSPALPAAACRRQEPPQLPPSSRSETTPPPRCPNTERSRSELHPRMSPPGSPALGSHSQTVKEDKREKIKQNMLQYQHHTEISSKQSVEFSCHIFLPLVPHFPIHPKMQLSAFCQYHVLPINIPTTLVQ